MSGVLQGKRNEHLIFRMEAIVIKQVTTWPFKRLADLH
jgi:hypothetical protein